MLRVARKVRIFPLVTLCGEVSAHLVPVMAHLEARGYSCEVLKTAYEFQKGGDEMLVVTSR